jgi:hypothetical protein
LREKAIPFLEGILGIHCAQDGHKVVLEGADGAFCRIDPVNMRWDTLKHDVVFVEGGL